MKTTGNATVDHLSKYLALRIALERRQQQEAGEPGGPGGGASDAGGPDGGGGEGGGTGGGDGPEEPALPSLEGVSEKQYTIYIAPGGGAFTVRASEGSAIRGERLGGWPGATQTLDPDLLTSPPSSLPLHLSSHVCVLSSSYSLSMPLLYPTFFIIPFSFFLPWSLSASHSYPLPPSPTFSYPASLFYPLCRH